MILYKYFFEIKNRSLLLLFTYLVTILTSYCYKETLLFMVVTPTFSYSNKKLIYFIFTDVTEIFLVFIKLITFFVNQIIILYIIYHLWLFFLPGLYKSEQLKIKFILKTIITTITIFIIIFHYFLLPLSWTFFLNFPRFLAANSITLYFEAKINEYLNFYLEFYYVCSLYFQLIILLIFFPSLIKKNFKTVKKFRKIFYFTFLIISTLFTPPDITSQILLSLFLTFSYEFIIFGFIFKNSI